MTPFKLDVVSLATVAVPATPVATFASISNAGIDGGAEWMTETPAGHPAPLFGAINKIQPQISFTTPQIDVVAANIATWGAAVAAKLYQKKSSGVAPFARSGTVHARHDVAQGVICWSQMTLPMLGVATANVMLRPIWNGTDLPIVANGSVALPAGVLVATNYFAAGPAYLNGSAIPDVQSISISSGVNFRGEGNADTVYHTYGELNLGQTVVTIKTLGQVNWGTVLISGLGLTDLTFFARAWANAETTSFVDDATASHILFNNAKCVARPVNTSADGQGLYSDTLEVLCLAPDDTHAPLSATLSSAITAP